MEPSRVFASTLTFTDIVTHANFNCDGGGMKRSAAGSLPLRRFRGLTLMVVLAMTVVMSWSASALPSGPPVVYVAFEETSDPFTYNIAVQASDPDGQILSIQLCIQDGSPCSTEQYSPTDDVVSSSFICVMGDSREMRISHTFAGRNTYRVIAKVTGAGCPVIGEPQTTDLRTGVLVDAPYLSPSPWVGIPCADPGTPAAAGDGVFEDRILMGATVAYPPPAELAHLEDGASAIHAAQSVVNSSGVCDRLFDITAVDDRADAEYGAFYIQNMIEEPRFALVAMPSAEGLRGALESGIVDNEAMPVVGTSGGTASEFNSPWVWPIGVSNADFADIAVGYAYERGARRFATVSVNDKRYGVEIAESVREAVSMSPGASLVEQISVRSGQRSHANEVAHFNAYCWSYCDAVIYGLDAATMLTWMESRPARANVVDLVSPHLMSRKFAEACGHHCDGLFAWTPFHPPVGESPEAARRYAAELKDFDPVADPVNPLTEGAYFGTIMMALAIGDSGVDLTRAGLKATMDSTAFDLGVTASPLSWTDSRAANRSMRGYELIYSGEHFIGWHDATGWTSVD